MPPVLRTCYSFQWYYEDADREPGELRALRGQYESTDPEVARAHILEAKAAGLNHIRLNWWGTRSGAGNEFYTHIHAACLVYAQVAAEEGMSWSIIWEATTLGTTAADLAQIEAFTLMPGYVDGPDGRKLVVVYNRIYDHWPLTDPESPVHLELLAKYYVVYDKVPDISQLPRGTGYQTYAVPFQSTMSLRAKYQDVIDNGKITLHAFVNAGFDNSGIFTPATGFSCTDPNAHTVNYPPGHQYSVGWTRWPDDESGYPNGHSVAWFWFQLQIALLYNAWEIMFVLNERGEHNMYEPSRTDIGNAVCSIFGFDTLYYDEIKKMTAWLDSPVKLGLQSIAGQDATLYDALAARLDQRYAVCRTWSRFLALPNAGQLTAVTDRQNQGGRCLLQLTGDPAGAPDNLALPPADLNAWISGAKAVIQAFLDAGVLIDAVSVWERPDQAAFWSGTPAQFHAFYTTVVPALQQHFPLLRIGGPSVSQLGGTSFEWWEDLFAACQAAGVRPGYFGMQQDKGFATDIERFGAANRLRQLYSQTTGRPTAEADAIPIYLDEWAYQLPDGSAHPELDDEHSAALLLATILSLAKGGFNGHSYYEIQDGSFSSADYDHKASGIFSLNDGPKATWAALKLLDSVLAFGDPWPVTRLEPAWSTAVHSSKNAQGHRRILLVNSARFDEQSALRYLEHHGADLSQITGQESIIKAFFQGEATYEQTGLPPEDEEAWTGAVELWNDYKASAEGPRDVRLQLDVEVGAIQDVVVIDHTRGNPSYWYDEIGSSYRQTFVSYKNGTGATLADVLDHPQAGAEPLTDLSGFHVDGRRITVTLQPHMVLAFTVVP
ncbi:MAG: hypothetical protein EYC70_00405 [Planctomycetota bacterium]|nr:MAG: hypothetical protein EYC70_00405 [Planctomycetota bacterium]